MNDAVLQTILAAKSRARKELAALPFAEKIRILEKLRERSRLISTSPLKQKAGKS